VLATLVSTPVTKDRLTLEDDHGQGRNVSGKSCLSIDSYARNVRDVASAGHYGGKRCRAREMFTRKRPPHVNR